MPTLNSLFWLILISISIELGFIVYLINWNSNLDLITVLVLLMSIIFSTNSIVHVSCAYFESLNFGGKKRIRNTLFTVGFPLSCSYLLKLITIILIISTDSFSLSSINYIYLTFGKSLLILVILGAFHELFLLPVLLSLSNSLCKKPIYSSSDKSLHDLSDLDLDQDNEDRDFFGRKSHKSYYKTSNREHLHEQPPFYYTEKWFDGKSLTVNRCATVTIPRLIMKQPKGGDKLNDNVNFLTGNKLNAINARTINNDLDKQPKNQSTAWSSNDEDLRNDVIKKFNQHWAHLNYDFRLESKNGKQLPTNSGDHLLNSKSKDLMKSTGLLN